MDQNETEYRLLKAKPRCKKLKPRIDLAAMVSVSFLLIIFFMVTKELSKPQAMDIGLPGCDDGHCRWGCGDHSRKLTLLLDGNNKIICYRGLLDAPDEAPKQVAYGKEGIRKELIKANTAYLSAGSYRSELGIRVIIKPSKKCSYGNLVDILDEMAITNIQTYAVINDFTPDEQQLLASR